MSIVTDTTAPHAPAASQLSDEMLVICWRLDTLVRAGYTDDAAAVLAVCPEIDLHRAAALARAGCPVETALQILL
jgi:hypothetical protein